MNTKMPFIFFILALALTLNSCAIYQQEFDCPPPCGVPCTSVTDLESMVVETENGPDLFLPEQESVVERISNAFKHKVWMPSECSDGYYLYKTESQQD